MAKVSKKEESPLVRRSVADWTVFALIALLYLAPLVIFYNVKPDGKGQLEWRVAHSHFGDQGHYLLMTASIIEDGDLEMTNNYYNALVHKTNSAGKYLRGMALDHHTILINGKTGQKFIWTAIFNAFNLQRLSDENPYRPGDVIPFDHHRFYFPEMSFEERAAVELTGFVEIPIHQVGLPLFASIFIFPFRFSYYFDTAALALSVIVSILGIWCLYLTVREYAPRWAVISAAAVALGTPLWLYSKTFYTEPYLAAFLIFAFYFILINKNDWAGGIFLGLAVIFKLTFLPVAGLFWIYLLYGREYRRLAALTMPLIISVLVILGFNQALMGSPFSFTQQYSVGNPLTGFYGNLLSPELGLLPFAPFLIFAVPGLFSLYRKNRDHSIIIICILMIFGVITILWKYWWIGTYSCRFLVPIIPILAIPLAVFLEENKNPLARGAFWILAAVSVVLNGFNAFDSIYCWGKPPWAVAEMFFRYFGI